MTEERLPLSGIRVLDFGMFWAGPFAGKWLGDAGAEVIKIESCSHPDNLRILARGVYPDGEPGERSWNRSGMINERNRNKLGLALEMQSDEGKAIFRELVAISDVVVENFSNRVLKSWGLDYPNLKAINPQIILASVYSQGSEGPESGFTSFGGTLEQLGGLTVLSGYEGEMPAVMTLQLPDPLGGAMGAALVLAALRQRRQTGEGLHIDLSQRENVTTVIGDAVLDYQIRGSQPQPMGNRDRIAAPHGAYRCQGDDEWVSIAVADDEEWTNLCRCLGRPELIADARFATVTARHRNAAEIDEAISTWTASREKHDAMVELQRCGVTAGAVYSSADLYADPHLAERDYWESVADPDAGMHRYPGRPMRLSRTPLSTRLPTPTLGEHNHYVLGELLGKSASEIDELEQHGIIGTEPTEAARRGRL